MRRLDVPPFLTTQRIEAFSDGVFAIAITLLVLEIKVPQLQTPTSSGDPLSLRTALLQAWPSYVGYIFSFVMIGIYWANHHYIFHLYQRSDHIFALLNVLFLMCISFLPFPTAILAGYITDPAFRQTAITFYAFGLFLPALSWLFVWLYASWQHRLIDRQLAPVFVTALTRQYALSTLLYLTAILIATWNGTAGLVLCVALTLLYMLPPKPPVYQATEGTPTPSR
jgi:uncharacterized membrane protein